MNSKKILLIGIVYVVQSVIAAGVISRDRILSEDGNPVRCGTRWKIEGVMYRVYFQSNGSTTDETTEAGIMDEFPEEDPLKTPLKDDTSSEQDLSTTTDPAMSGEVDLSPEHDTPITNDPPVGSGAETPSEPQRRLVYEYCVDEDTKLVMYTRYEIEKPELMKPSEPTLDRQYSVILGPYEKQPSDMTRFTSISDTRKYYEKVIDYYSQMVVVPDFSPEFKIKKAFYEYDVSAPLNVELRNPWNELIKEIKKKIHMIAEPINVFSGTYDIYRLHGISSYIIPTKHILPVPFAWWILLYNKKETHGISVIMQNFAFSPGEETNLLCPENLCPQLGLQVPKYSRANIYCCPAQTILEEYPFTKNPVDKFFNFFQSKEEILKL